MPYSPKDFAQNPGKYQLFRTAQIATHVFTQNGENDLEKGEHVAIEYFRTAPNRLFHRNEPVYAVTKIGGQFFGHIYANTLENFTL